MCSCRPRTAASNNRMARANTERFSPSTNTWASIDSSLKIHRPSIATMAIQVTISAPATLRFTMHRAEGGKRRTSIVMLQMEPAVIRLNAIMKSITERLETRQWADRVPPCNPRQMQPRRNFIVMETGSAAHKQRRHIPHPIIHSHPRPLHIKLCRTDRISLDIRSSIMFRRPRVHIQRVTRQMAIHQVSKMKISFFMTFWASLMRGIIQHQIQSRLAWDTREFFIAKFVMFDFPVSP